MSQNPSGSVAWYRHLASVLALPFTVTILIPAGILFFVFRQDSRWPMDQEFYWLFRTAGVLLGVVGISFVVWTNILFSKIGSGTLAPWDPTQKLVIAGPYRYVRNPMIAGVLMILVAESVGFGSWLLGCWSAFFFTLNTIYFVMSEEPGLKKRFGQEFETYSKHVPRWIPRFSPWSLDSCDGEDG